MCRRKVNALNEKDLIGQWGLILSRTLVEKGCLGLGDIFPTWGWRNSSLFKHPSVPKNISSKYPFWSIKNLGFWKILPDKNSQWLLWCKPFSWSNGFRIACEVAWIRESEKEENIKGEDRIVILSLFEILKYFMVWQMDRRMLAWYFKGCLYQSK